MVASPILTFDLSNEPSRSREDLVVSNSNFAAIALIDSWPEWHASYAILSGPNGCGKTHLAEIWLQMSGAFSADLSDLTPAISVAQTGMPILIDGLQPDNFIEEDLFHLMNAVRGAATQMLMTTKTDPFNWRINTPDLASRLKAATSVVIDAPDDALIAAVIVKLFADRQKEIDPAIVEFLGMRVERSLGAVNKIVTAIDQLCLAKKSNVTKPIVSQILKEFELVDTK